CSTLSTSPLFSLPTTRLPPKPHLFPYTTLFRSLRVRHGQQRRHALSAPLPALVVQFRGQSPDLADLIGRLGRPAGRLREQPPRTRRERERRRAAAPRRSPGDVAVERRALANGEQRRR